MRLYYFTGTGNSLWAARFLARRLGAPEPTSLVRALKLGEVAPTEDRIGLVVPIYMYRLPHLVVGFIRRLQTRAPVFVVATGGGDPGDFFLHVQRLFRARGLDLAQGFFCAMQSNYIPFGGAPDEKVVAEKLQGGVTRLTEIAALLDGGQRFVETEYSRMRAWIHPGLLYRLGYKYIPATDQRYLVDESCNGCGICARVCPVDNIELAAPATGGKGRPVWKKSCQQCYACLQYCPKEAIQYQQKTRGYRRYHHPEIGVNDLVAQKG